MPRLGQHFLKNKAVRAEIATVILSGDENTIIEIGPGHGELTDLLVAGIADSATQNIIAIEKDPALFCDLQKKFADQKKISVRQGDALKILPGLAKDLSSESFCVVGNIPYYITGKLLRTLSDLEQKPKRAVLMVQKEVAERMCAAPPEMNRLAASVQFWADAKMVLQVPKKDFSPPPEIDSAVASLALKKQKEPIDAARYYEAVRAIFSQPRKTLLNNLTGGAVKKYDYKLLLEKLGVDPGARPQDLDIEAIIILAKNFF